MLKRQKCVLDLLADNELKIGKLYENYSRKVPDMEEFWKSLAKEERGHFKALIAVKRELKGETRELFEKNDYSRGIIKYVMDFIDREIGHSLKKNISQIYAINCALRLEQSMVEEKCFEIFNPKVKKLKKVMEELNRETKKHAQWLRKEMKKYRE